MHFKMIHVPTTLIVGMKQRISDPSQAPKLIISLWQQFFKERSVQEIEHIALPLRILSIYTEYEKDGSYAHIVGVPVTKLENIASPFITCTIPEGMYSVWNGYGKPEIVHQAWQDIWQSEKQSLRNFTIDWEEYPGVFDPNIEMPINIYLALT